MNYIAIFLLYLASDFAGANWAAACGSKSEVQAGLFSMSYHLLHGLGILLLVHDPWTIIPLACGGGLGSFFATKWRHVR